MKDYNKIISYHIDDKQYFIDLFKRENVSEQGIAEIIGNQKYLTATLTLYGYKHNGYISLDRYKLTDCNGQAMNINDLNGYERGIVINECYKHFYEDKADLHGTFEIIA